MRFTHTGWFLFCPVLVDLTDIECPILEPRWPVLAPAFWFAELVSQAWITTMSMASHNYEPHWAVTGLKAIEESSDGDA